MAEEHILTTVIILIATAIFIVASFKHFNVSPVLGYLVAGALIGDHGFQIVTFEQTRLLGEIGVVFLLFAIGLELSFERLKAMRIYVFGLGTLQVLITAILIGASVILLLGDNNAAIIIGGGLALSSTAIVIQVIEEKHKQSAQIGRIALAILLLQDFIVVPLLVVVPILAGKTETSLAVMLGHSLIKAIVALTGIFIAGRVLLRPLFALISADTAENNELSIALTLLIVLSAAWGTEYFGLSLALGAFVSGVLVAETDFRLKAEESIYPFKSLLLGLFFMSVGMNIDAQEIYRNIASIITFTAALIIVKALIITALCITFGFKKGVSLNAGLLLSQGGEFAFILFGLGKEHGILQENVANVLLLVVTCSMAITPLLAMLGQKIAEKLDASLSKTPLEFIEFGAKDLTKHVIIAGFGKVGKMVARMLAFEEINYIAVDLNEELVKKESDDGFPVFRGDLSNIETLKALGAERAITVILTTSNEVTIKKTVKIIANNYPNLDIIIRLKDLKKSHDFFAAGATVIIPEDYETGLQLGGAALKTIGINENHINSIKAQFRLGNYLAIKQEDNTENEENE